MDGSLGDNCDWTFTVEEGSTTANPLTFTRAIEDPADFCLGIETNYTTEAERGATLYFWTLDGSSIGVPKSNTLSLNLQDVGVY